MRPACLAHLYVMCVYRRQKEITLNFRTKASESCSELQKVTVPKALTLVGLYNVLFGLRGSRHGNKNCTQLQYEKWRIGGRPCRTKDISPRLQEPLISLYNYSEHGLWAWPWWFSHTAIVSALKPGQSPCYCWKINTSNTHTCVYFLLYHVALLRLIKCPPLVFSTVLMEITMQHIYVSDEKKRVVSTWFEQAHSRSDIDIAI